MRLKYILSMCIVMMTNVVNAQKVGVSTNLLDLAALGTLNADVSYAVSRHWSLTAGARINPFTYNQGTRHGQFQYRQQSYAVGARLWPWHIWSGWWFASKLRYQEYNIGGILSQETRQGDRIGMGLYSGFTHMLSRNLNMEFGLGFWGGTDIYELFDCPSCGLTVDKGQTVFVLPDDIMISLVYVF